MLLLPPTAGNQGRSMMSSSPANCPSALAVTSASDYDGLPGGLSTPDGEADKDDSFTDFSNWGNNETASRTIAGPGEDAVAVGGALVAVHVQPCL